MNRAALLVLGLLGALMMLAAACGGGDDAKPTLTRAPTASGGPAATSQPTATVAPTATTASPATTAPMDTVTPPAPGVSLEISAEGDKLEFDTDSFEVAAGDQVFLVYDNVSTINQHNWVLVKAGTKDDVATRGAVAGPANDWVQPEDPDVFAQTKLLNPGEVGDVSFAAPPPGTYQFVCTFPGHNLTMFGDFVVTP